MGSNPITVKFSHLFGVKIVMFVWVRLKINHKEAGNGPLKMKLSLKQIVSAKMAK